VVFNWGDEVESPGSSQSTAVDDVREAISRIAIRNTA